MRVAVTGATGVLGRHFLAQVRRALNQLAEEGQIKL